MGDPTQPPHPIVSVDIEAVCKCTEIIFLCSVQYDVTSSVGGKPNTLDHNRHNIQLYTQQTRETRLVPEKKQAKPKIVNASEQRWAKNQFSTFIYKEIIIVNVVI